MLLPLNVTTSEAAEAEEAADTWVELQEALLNVNEKRTLDFNTIVETVQSWRICKTIEQSSSEVLSSLTAQDQLNRLNDVEYVSQIRCFSEIL